MASLTQEDLLVQQIQEFISTSLQDRGERMTSAQRHYWGSVDREMITKIIRHVSSSVKSQLRDEGFAILAAIFSAQEDDEG